MSNKIIFDLCIYFFTVKPGKHSATQRGMPQFKYNICQRYECYSNLSIMKEDDIIFVGVFNLLTKRFKYVFLSFPKIILIHSQTREAARYCVI